MTSLRRTQPCRYRGRESAFLEWFPWRLTTAARPTDDWNVEAERAIMVTSWPQTRYSRPPSPTLTLKITSLMMSAWMLLEPGSDVRSAAGHQARTTRGRATAVTVGIRLTPAASALFAFTSGHQRSAWLAESGHLIPIGINTDGLEAQDEHHAVRGLGDAHRERLLKLRFRSPWAGPSPKRPMWGLQTPGNSTSGVVAAAARQQSGLRVAKATKGAV